MKKHRTHQIDTRAQTAFRAALPHTWVFNEQRNDYGKDYLVEVGDHDGDLSGIEFFVQLKGQETASYAADGRELTFSLERKHAEYYADKVRTLAVFLVVADVTSGKCYYLFVQPSLLGDQSWRKQKSVTLHLPVRNDLADHRRLREAVLGAARLMRQLHPEAIPDALAAQRSLIQEMDPRFDVSPSLDGDRVLFHLVAREPVPVRLKFNPKRRGIRKRISDLFDKGAVVDFKPGDVAIEGSKLFEPLTTFGGRLQCAFKLPGAVTLICLDGDAKELGRLSEIPGELTGGQSEGSFKGDLDSSPLAVTLEALGQAARASMKVSFTLTRWEGQRLRHLAYFDRIFGFFRVIATSLKTRIEATSRGNRIFHGEAALRGVEFLAGVAQYLTLLDKARKVAAHFGINPTWSLAAFDKDSRETAEDLYAIFFEEKLVERMPHVSISMICDGESFRWDTFKKAGEHISVVSDWTYTLLGEEIAVGKLTHEYTELMVQAKQPRAKRGRRPAKNREVALALKGSANTLRTIWAGDRIGGEG